MQHRLISHENACELIDHLNAEEIHSTGWSQAFKGKRGNQVLYILLTGQNEALVIEQSTKLKLIKSHTKLEA
jgi:hypothetical protein